MAKPNLTKLQEEAFKDAGVPKLVFAEPKVKTEMYAVRIPEKLAEDVRDFCKFHELRQQDFMEWAIENSLGVAKAEATRLATEQQKKEAAERKKHARTKVRGG